MTDREHELVDLLGQVYNEFRAITGSSSTRDDDLLEVAFHIHALQHAVMAQAAARSYPIHYRPLGGTYA
jgi:hypothetical protein